MCDSRQPLNGADSEPHDGDQKTVNGIEVWYSELLQRWITVPDREAE